MMPLSPPVLLAFALSLLLFGCEVREQPGDSPAEQETQTSSKGGDTRAGGEVGGQRPLVDDLHGDAAAIHDETLAHRQKSAATAVLQAEDRARREERRLTRQEP